MLRRLDNSNFGIVSSFDIRIWKLNLWIKNQLIRKILQANITRR